MKILIFAMSAFLFFLNTVHAADIAPSSMRIRTGTASGGLAAMGTLGDSRSINVYTNRKGNLSIDFTFSSVAANDSIAIGIRLFRASDSYHVAYIDAAGNARRIGSITGSSLAQEQVFAIPNAAINGGNAIFRLSSSAGADDAQLEGLAVRKSATEPPPPPPIDPVPPNEPVPPGEPQPNLLTPGISWYWQLQGTINTQVNAKVYVIDLFDSSTSLIQSLKASGKIVICYFSAGSYENWRSDASQFPAEILGKSLDGWAGERWLDVRSPATLAIMAKRLDLAKSKGCQGVEPDNVDGYGNDTGFALTPQNQINYNGALADQAKQRGLLIALKNATDIVKNLVDKFDFAIVESCFRWNECPAYSPFIEKGKAVLNAEYSTYSETTCRTAKELKFSTTFYNLNLDGKLYKPCP